jgi:hypothetical protein
MDHVVVTVTLLEYPVRVDGNMICFQQVFVDNNSVCFCFGFCFRFPVCATRSFGVKMGEAPGVSLLWDTFLSPCQRRNEVMSDICSHLCQGLTCFSSIYIMIGRLHPFRLFES